MPPPPQLFQVGGIKTTGHALVMGYFLMTKDNRMRGINDLDLKNE